MKQLRRITLFFSFSLLPFLLVSTGFANPVTQTINLSVGWNAVFIEVDPISTAPADVFATVLKDASQNDNLISVWMWNPDTGTVEFIQNPSELTASQPQYSTYLPGNSILTTLYAVHGNRAYLINMTTAATLTISGEPLPPKINWKSNSFNFVGFHLDPGNLTTFTDYFTPSAAHADQEVYVLDNATGSWVLGSSATMAAGEGFWIYCQGSSEFYGSASVQLNQRNTIAFGQILEQQEITVKNSDDAPQIISLNLTDVGTLPIANYPLFYWDFDTTSGVAQWIQFPTGSSLDLTILPGETQAVKLGVKRVGLAADINYIANMEIRDPVGSLFRVPVTVTGISYSGLWVGDVAISKVNQPAETVVPQPTGSLFSFRLILHHSDSSLTNLMTQVIQMWQDGTWKPDPTDLSKQIIDDPGTFVLFSDDALIPFYSGASLRDGQPVGRRISSPVFGNLYDSGAKVNHKAMTGTFAEDNSELTITFTLPADDPTNPFVHKFHPDHLVPDGQTPAEKVFEITRTVTLTFSDTDADGNPVFGNSSLGWGSSALGGIYDETISGLMHGADIHLQGNFALHRASDIGTLNE